MMTICFLSTRPDLISLAFTGHQVCLLYVGKQGGSAAFRLLAKEPHVFRLDMVEPPEEQYQPGVYLLEAGGFRKVATAKGEALTN